MVKFTRIVLAVIIMIVLAIFGAVTFVGQENFFGFTDSFFSSITKSFSLPDTTMRNVTFSLDIGYSNQSFTFDNPINMTIDSQNITLLMANSLKLNSSFHVTSFKGVAHIIDNEVYINGSYVSIDIGDVVISSSGSFATSTSPFNNIFFEGMRLKEMVFPVVSGTLDMNDIKMTLENQTVEVSAPDADLYYSADKIVASGKANRISVRGTNSISVR